MINYYPPLLIDVEITGILPLDLFKATKLIDLMFRSRRSVIQLLTTMLQTIGSRNLQQITIHPYTTNSDDPIGETGCQEWRDLDSLLVQLWTSHSIFLQLLYGPDNGGKIARAYAPSLLPELTRRGIIGLIQHENQLHLGSE